MLGILGHIPDYTQARAIVNQLLDAVTPGSYLAITDPTHGKGWTRCWGIGTNSADQQ